MKLNFYISAVALGIMAVSACKKNEPISKNSKATIANTSLADTDVYAAGYVFTDPTNMTDPDGRSPVYWKNGVLTQLPEINGGGYATGIAMQKGDVMISGVVAGPGNGVTAAYWRNGALTTLAPGAITNGIFISMCSCDFYIAGGIDVGSSPTNIQQKACYWKDGIIHMLPSSGIDASANAITVNGNDVYVTGMVISSTNSVYAVYWKNDTLYKLTDTLGMDSGVGNGIAVSGNDVYIAGSRNNYPAYWKNGIAVSLSGNTSFATGAQATSVALLGGDVYVAGNTTTNGGGVYWKNNILTSLSNGTYYAYLPNCITLSGNNVYIGGRVATTPAINQTPPTIPAYWKNNSLTILPYTGTGGNVMAIAIVPHQ